MRFGPRGDGVFAGKGSWKDPVQAILRQYLEADSTEPLAPLPRPEPVALKRKRKRSFSPKKDRPACAACGIKHWLIITDHEAYRDPFLECGGCKQTFRMDLSPFDIAYAWRDGIQMPQEVQFRYDTNHRDFSERFALRPAPVPAGGDDVPAPGPVA